MERASDSSSKATATQLVFLYTEASQRLRGDPGGLLDQAIRVADEFVDSGTIVTTVGYANKQREEKRS